jgi:hypothetical protein
MEATSLFAIQGHLLKLGDGREVALYRRDGTLWAADFVDGRCEIVEAARWFGSRDGARALARARRRHEQTSNPIPEELAETIECLHFILAPQAAYARSTERRLFAEVAQAA